MLQKYLTIASLLLIYNIFSYSEHKKDIETITTENIDSASSGRVKPLTYYDWDNGWWIGIKSGIQTNGGPIPERWTVLGLVEYRFAGIASIPIDFHVWRVRIRSYDGIKYQTYYSTYGSMGVGLKFRVYLKKINFYVQGSIGTGLGLNPLNLWYAIGSEYLLNDKFGIVIDLRKNWFPEYDYFTTIGINISFKKLIKQ